MTTSARPFPVRFVSSAPVLIGFPLRFPFASSFFPSGSGPFPFPCLPFRILSFLFFLSALRRFRLPVAFPTPRFHLSVLPDLPLPYRLVSRSVSPVPLIRLLCSFPFALPCFAPTAVPQVLPFSSASYCFLSRICPCVRSRPFHLSQLPAAYGHFAPVRLGPWLLSLCFFLSPLQPSASQGLPVCPPRFPHPLRLVLRFGFPPSLRSPPLTFVPFGSLRSGLGTRSRCSSFHRFTVCLTAALRIACLPSRVQAFPLASACASALGSGYWA